MKRNNKILLGLLALLLVMSTGYALFSKEITIGGNVTAKGSFNITLSCTKSVHSDVINAMVKEEGGTASEYTTYFNSLQHGYTTDSCSVSGNTVTMNTALSYPGAMRYYTIGVKNTGDIAAKWNYKTGFDFDYYICDGATNDCGNNMKDDLNLENSYDIFSDMFWELVPSIRHATKRSSSGTVTLLINNDIDEVVDSEGYIYLQPGETLYFIANNLWRAEDYDTDSYNYAYGHYQIFKPTFRFNFEQATE